MPICFITSDRRRGCRRRSPGRSPTASAERSPRRWSARGPARPTAGDRRRRVRRLRQGGRGRACGVDDPDRQSRCARPGAAVVAWPRRAAERRPCRREGRREYAGPGAVGAWRLRFSGERSPRPSECRATRRATSPPSGFASGSQPKADIDRSEARTHNRTHDDAFARLDLDPSRRFGRAGELLLCQGGWDELTRD